MFSFTLFGADNKAERENSPGDEFLKLLPTFHAAQLWRVIIDGHRQNEGPLAFDTGDNAEHGYLEGMLEGLDFIAATLHEPITCDYIEKLHDLSIALVKANIEAHNEEYQRKRLEQDALDNNNPDHNFMDINPPKPVPDLNFRHNLRVHFGVKASYPCGSQSEWEKIEKRANLSEEGFAELAGFIKKINNKYGDILSLERCETTDSDLIRFPIDLDCTPFSEIQTLIKKGERIVVTSDRMDKEFMKKIITDLINEFQIELSVAKTAEPREIIKKIVTFIRQLEVLHPFTDANCRTFCVLLLNKLLLQNYLSPVILSNPNRFDAYSCNELVDDVVSGQEKFNSYKNYLQCNDILKSINKLINENPYFTSNKISQLDGILLQYNVAELDNKEQLNLIEHIYHRLLIQMPKNVEEYLPLLNKVYRDTLSKMDGILSPADLRRFKAELQTHCLGKMCQDMISELKPISKKMRAEIF